MAIGDHAMNQIADINTLSLLACDEGFDPIENRMRANIPVTIKAVFNEEMNGFLGRSAQSFSRTRKSHASWFIGCFDDADVVPKACRTPALL